MKKTKKLFFVLLSLLVASYLTYQIAAYFTGSLKTEVTTLSTEYESIPVSGIFLKDEVTIDLKSDNAKVFGAESGQKVAKGSKLISYYSDVSQIENDFKLKQLSRKIDLLSLAITGSDSAVIDIEKVDEEIVSSVMALSRMGDEGTASTATDVADRLLSNLNKKQVILGNDKPITRLIDNLKSERDTVKSKLASPVSTLYAPKSGYFFEKCDNLESELTAKKALSLNPADVDAFFSKAYDTVSDPSKVKIMSEFVWYFAFNIDESQSKTFEIGKEIFLRFGISGNTLIPCIVERVSPPEGNKCAVVVSSGVNIPDLNSKRAIQGEVVLSSKKGLKLSKNALRFLNGKQGVYIAVGSLAKFRQVEVIFSNKNYYLVKYDPAVRNSLVPFDEVILKGRNVADGKTIR